MFAFDTANAWSKAGRRGSTSPTKTTTRCLRRTSKRFDRRAHELDLADPGIDHIAQDRFGALVGHAAIAVRDRPDVHAVDNGIRFRLSKNGERTFKQRRSG
jgi:hypothetical protein